MIAYARFWHLFVLFVFMTALLTACGGAAETPPAATPAGIEATASPVTGAEVANPQATEGAGLMTPVQPDPTADAPTATAPEQPTAEPTITTTPLITTTPEVTTEPVEAVGLALVAEGFTSPVGLIDPGDGSGRLFVVDQIGVIRIISTDGQVIEAPFLDVRDRMVALNEDYDERGLLGLAFHPNYGTNGRFFVYYSAPLAAGAPSDWNHTSILAEFSVSADNPNMADPASAQIVLQVNQPQTNHNAGQIAFGPDGYLYVPLGDGGGANDNDVGHVDDWYDVNEGGNAQSPAENWLGSVLRLDVDNEGTGGQPYSVPADNPFAGRGGPLEATFAYGFRNPYGIAFDPGSGDLFLADAGQNLWEEVNLVTAGGNYGWNVKEGTHCFSTANPDQSLDDCPDMDADGQPFIDPIIEFPNGQQEDGLGLVVVGGAVYRGSALPGLDGHYIFGQWSTSFANGDGSLFVATPGATDGLWSMRDLPVTTTADGRLGAYLLALGQDAAGEVYVLTTDTAGPSGNTGRVYRIVPAETQQP